MKIWSRTSKNCFFSVRLCGFLFLPKNSKWIVIWLVLIIAHSFHRLFAILCFNGISKNNSYCTSLRLISSTTSSGPKQNKRPNSSQNLFNVIDCRNVIVANRVNRACSKSSTKDLLFVCVGGSSNIFLSRLCVISLSLVLSQCLFGKIDKKNIQTKSITRRVSGWEIKSGRCFCQHFCFFFFSVEIESSELW